MTRSRRELWVAGSLVRDSWSSQMTISMKISNEDFNLNEVRRVGRVAGMSGYKRI